VNTAITTHFVTLELPLQESPAAVLAAITQALESHGEPLRWAITSIHGDRHVMGIEAVVLCPQAQTCYPTAG
jgi:hypothetical protein